jgi:DNA-binding CsgD family transcriptional regulator
VRLAQLAALAEAGPLEAALGAGVLIAEGERVRLSHPLLATAARGRAQAGERRALHRALAATIADPERRARHLALATAQPDGELAARLDAAARAAAARGASEDAVELAGHALRLTPPATPARDERLVALAEFLDIAGEERRVVELLAPEIDALAHGMARSRALVLLADNAVGGAAEYEERLTQALAEAADDPLRRAPVLARLSLLGALTRVERLGDAEAWAREALPAARRAGAEVERDLLHALAWARSMRGHPVDEERARFAAASPAMSSMDRSVERVAAVRLGWRGEVEEARAELTRLLALADERGEAWSYAALRLHRCEVELRAGGWDAAARLLDEWEASADGVLFVAPAYERCRALLAVGRGDREDAERWVVRVLAGVEATGVRWEQLEALRTRGIAALMADDAARAVESLQQVWDVTQREGVDDPGTFPVAPDLAEALAESGAHGAAAAVADRVQELGERQAHPWALVTARRCRALAQLAAPGPDDDAATELEQAAAGYADLGLPFDHARTLLLLGRAQRRRRKWGEARRCLEAAAAGFRALGSPGWAEQASSELARVGARRPRPAGELTATEERVARLAADGRSNKEIAQALFVTVHTVEAHLSHAYAKLGVRSRGQLAGRL